MPATYFLVRGRVQGVGYRFFVEREAREAGIRGWVRNRADGSVEILAIARTEVLAEFRRRLEQGPPAARVTAVEAEAAQLSAGEEKACNSFVIEPSE